MNNGLKEIMKAPGGSLEIHNSGGYKYKITKNENVASLSIISDYSVKPIINEEYIPDNFIYLKKTPIIKMKTNNFSKIR